MKAEELRVGDYIKRKDGQCDLDDEIIPLTSKWIEDCGFSPFDSPLEEYYLKQEKEACEKVQKESATVTDLRDYLEDNDVEL